MTRKWEPWERKRGESGVITRRQWQTSRSPGQMGRHLSATHRAHETRSGIRKLRLFNIACCRRGWELLEHDPVRPVLEAAERHADGAYRGDRLARLIDRVRTDVLDSLPRWIYVSEDHFYWRLRDRQLPQQIDHLRLGILGFANPQGCGLDTYYLTIAHGVAGLRLVSELSVQCALLRDIFGDPFRPVRFSPAWRTDTAILLAKQMYESRDFSAMPILADALQDADSNDDAILSHCRDPKQVHVRGCWVVDAVLGKKCVGSSVT